MARIFITGSADGLGQLAAKALINLGHQVVLHARNAERGGQALKNAPGAEDVLTADLSDMEEIKTLAAKANASGNFDAVIHNAAIYGASANSINKQGLPGIFVVNSLAPYILTCLMKRPARLIYLSSGMHLQGNPGLNNLDFRTNSGKIPVSYADTKLHDVILSMAVARKWSDVYSNVVNPGWVPTKMGGSGATDSLEKGFETQVWLAVSDDAAAKVSGGYFYHKKQEQYLAAAANAAVQEKFLTLCAQITGIVFPQGHAQQPCQSES